MKSTKQKDLSTVDQIHCAFSTLPDCRKPGNNQKYALEDAVLSAFSFFSRKTRHFVMVNHQQAVRSWQFHI